MVRNEPDTLVTTAARVEGFEQFMGLIEIPNTCNLGMGGKGRQVVVGESIVAVDLINTVAAPGSPVPDDLLAAGGAVRAWWKTEEKRLPGGELPDVGELCRLRSALRELIGSLVDGHPAPVAAISELNVFMDSAPTSMELLLTKAGLSLRPRWHQDSAGSAQLAFIATEAAQFLSDPAQAARLRRCANPACSMIFIAINPRRSWCAAGVCGNRVRVARHHRRQGRS
jgi:predicted RNA-binding Zn ribbon-like protein